MFQLSQHVRGAVEKGILFLDDSCGLGHELGSKIK